MRILRHQCGNSIHAIAPGSSNRFQVCLRTSATGGVGSGYGEYSRHRWASHSKGRPKLTGSRRGVRGRHDCRHNAHAVYLL